MKPQNILSMLQSQSGSGSSFGLFRGYQRSHVASRATAQSNVFMFRGAADASRPAQRGQILAFPGMNAASASIDLMKAQRQSQAESSSSELSGLGLFSAFGVQPASSQAFAKRADVELAKKPSADESPFMPTLSI